MRIQPCAIILPLLLTAPWPATAQEVCRDVLTTAINGPRVVTECQRTGSSEGMRWASGPVPGAEWETLQLNIPGYERGDGEKHIYVFTYFSDSGVGNTNLYPDEFGSAQVSLLPMPGPDGEPAQRARIISSVNVESGDERFSMDLTDVSANAFVNALYNARMNLAGDLAMLRGEPRRRPFQDGVPPRNDLVLEQRRVTLAGENLSLDETLDLLYQVSGCSVFLKGNFLVAESCR